MKRIDSQCKRNISIGIFYDGNYFFHVSNYYFRAHEKGRRLSIHGLHNFITHKIAELEGTDPAYCHIVDAHYFRGRISATEAKERDSLFTERTFEQVLMRERVVTHYLPLTPIGEKGVDVWLALEAFEQTIHKRFDVLCLIACDGDFIPLVRKLNSLGTRVMILGWEFRHEDQYKQIRETVTSSNLLEEATYPMQMHEIIDDPANADDPLIEDMFVEKRDLDEVPDIEPSEKADGTGLVKYINKALKDGYGYGFISRPDEQDDLYFYCHDVAGLNFDDLKIGDVVEYVLGNNDRGICAKQVRVITQEPG